MAIRTLRELSAALQDDSTLLARVKTDPVSAIQKIAMEAPIPDTVVYRLVVISIGLALLIVVIGGLALVFMNGKDLPAALVSIGSAAIGALAGLLAPSPVSQK